MSEKTTKNDSTGRKEGGDTHTVQKDTIALELSSTAIPVLLAEAQMKIFQRIAEALENIQSSLWRLEGMKKGEIDAREQRRKGY